MITARTQACNSLGMRNHVRQVINSNGAIAIPGGHKRILIKDFSRMGLGFVCEDLLQLKTFISILYQNEIDQVIQMKSYIKHIRKIKNGLYFVGVQFIGIESKFGREA